MIKHVVCYKVKEEKKHEIEEAKRLLLSLKSHVREVVKIEVGSDFLHSERSYDLILIIYLRAKEDLEKYQKNTYHENVVKPFMHDIRQASVSVDFECEEN